MMTIIFLTITAAFAAESARPVPQTGVGCPPGYSGSPTSGYCVPGPNTNQRAVPQRGVGCPSGFSLSPTSNYCVETLK